ncbi:unnamed protein product, partial [Polarella glacialis]
ERRFFSELKAEAIGRGLHDFYSQYEGQSWKNVISVGDSDFERLGTHTAIKEYVSSLSESTKCLRTISPTVQEVEVNGHLHRVRTKTMKLMEQPSIQELTEELKVLSSWLQNMVRLDDGFDLSLRDVDDGACLEAIDRHLRQGSAGSCAGS